MREEINQPYPARYTAIDEATRISGFTMASDVQTCSLLRTLAATKPSGRFLELGTGTGLSTSWILDGMDAHSSLISIDNDPGLLKIAKQFLGEDDRLHPSTKLLSLMHANLYPVIITYFHSLPGVEPPVTFSRPGAGEQCPFTGRRDHY